MKKGWVDELLDLLVSIAFLAQAWLMSSSRLKDYLWYWTITELKPFLFYPIAQKGKSIDICAYVFPQNLSWYIEILVFSKIIFNSRHANCQGSFTEINRRTLTSADYQQTGRHVYVVALNARAQGGYARSL